MKREINYDIRCGHGLHVVGDLDADFIRLGHCSGVLPDGRIVLLLDRGDNFNIIHALGAPDQCLSHAACRPKYCHLCHISFNSFRHPLSFALCSLLISQSGRRYTSSTSPIIAIAAFTGIGFVSTKRSENSR